MSILDEILVHKRNELSSRKRERSQSDLEKLPAFRRPLTSIRRSLLNHAPFAVIAEIKRSSPSAGSMYPDADAAAIASAYEMAGAAAISVLTDMRYFGGSISDLSAVRAATTLPVLRKEFIIDHYQITEARAHGADAILLIAAALERSHLTELHAHARSIGLETLVEVHEEREIASLDLSRMTLIGINNRNLKTMVTDIDTTPRLKSLLPDDVLIISESGIHDSASARKLMEAGVRAGLVGEQFMKTGDPGAALRSFLAGIGS